MLKYIFSTCFLFFGTIGWCQFGPQKIVTQTANGTQIIATADIDGDGNLDLVSANKFGNSITWYKNLDGLGTFGSENLIASLSETTFVSVADIDGDGDIDLIAVASFIDLVVWYENLDGQGNFSTQKIISNQADGASSVSIADIDGDGDMDIVSASDFSGLAWYENLDGQGNFSPTIIIDNTLSNSRSVVAVDMDGDGDGDILGNSSDTERIFWIENMDGLGNFGDKHMINDSGSYSNVIFAADVDNDGDSDVFSASPGDNEVAWYQNLDGLGNFGPKNSITNTLESSWTVHAADLDNDGDVDVLSTFTGVFDGEIVWFENLDGTGDFGEQQTISIEVQSPRSVIAADIDNDGDMDVIASSQNDDKIAWYENFTILGVEETLLVNLAIFPNPVKDILKIEGKAGLSILTATLYDTFGRMLFTKKEDVSQINFSTYSTGIYYLKIETYTGEQVFKVAKE